MEKKIRSYGKLKSEKGLSLVEVMIGVLLLGLIGLFLMGSFRTFMVGARTTGDRTQALFLAQQALEVFKRNDGVASENQNWNYTSPDSKYTITSSEPNIDSGGTTNLVPRQVTVTWTTPQGTESLSLVGYYYQ